MTSIFQTDASFGTVINFDDILVGEIIIWPTDSNIPEGFILCDGGSLNRTTYSELFSIIGEKFGYPTSSEFNVPDLMTDNSNNSKLLRGSGSVPSDITGSVSGNNLININAIESHTHNINLNNTFTKEIQSTVSMNNISIVVTMEGLNNTGEASIKEIIGGQNKTPVVIPNHAHKIERNSPVSTPGEMTGIINIGNQYISEINDQININNISSNISTTQSSTCFLSNKIKYIIKYN